MSHSLGPTQFGSPVGKFLWSSFITGKKSIDAQRMILRLDIMI